MDQLLLAASMRSQQAEQPPRAGGEPSVAPAPAPAPAPVPAEGTTTRAVPVTTTTLTTAVVVEGNPDKDETAQKRILSYLKDVNARTMLISDRNSGRTAASMLTPEEQNCVKALLNAERVMRSPSNKNARVTHDRVWAWRREYGKDRDAATKSDYVPEENWTVLAGCVEDEFRAARVDSAFARGHGSAVEREHRHKETALVYRDPELARHSLHDPNAAIEAEKYGLKCVYCAEPGRGGPRLIDKDTRICQKCQEPVAMLRQTEYGFGKDLPRYHASLGEYLESDAKYEQLKERVEKQEGELKEIQEQSRCVLHATKQRRVDVRSKWIEEMNSVQDLAAAPWRSFLCVLKKKIDLEEEKCHKETGTMIDYISRQRKPKAELERLGGREALDAAKRDRDAAFEAVVSDFWAVYQRVLRLHVHVLASDRDKKRNRETSKECRERKKARNALVPAAPAPTPASSPPPTPPPPPPSPLPVASRLLCVLYESIDGMEKAREAGEGSQTHNTAPTVQATSAEPQSTAKAPILEIEELD